jgi:disulfide oxidoreductase YuzD
MDSIQAIKWLSAPEDKDFPAAESYLTLLFEPDRVADLIELLRSAPMAHFKAKDIFRASGLPLLDGGNYHVAKDREKIRQGKGLSPILLVRDTVHGKLIIADGYHRLCAVYSFSEDEPIPCMIV